MHTCCASSFIIHHLLHYNSPFIVNTVSLVLICLVISILFIIIIIIIIIHNSSSFISNIIHLPTSSDIFQHLPTWHQKQKKNTLEAFQIPWIPSIESTHSRTSGTKPSALLPMPGPKGDTWRKHWEDGFLWLCFYWRGKRSPQWVVESKKQMYITQVWRIWIYRESTMKSRFWKESQGPDWPPRDARVFEIWFTLQNFRNSVFGSF